jgi:hypothetical protein
LKKKNQHKKVRFKGESDMMNVGEGKQQGVVIQGLDLVDITAFIDKKNKKFQAILLTEIEEIIDKNSPEFKAIRKQVLDGYNNYTRSIVRAIFGDVENM